MASVQQLIAAINPDLYYDYKGDLSKLKKFKDLIKEKGPYEAVSERLLKGDSVEVKSEDSYKLVYDSSSETLEPIYFFILDLMNDRGLKVEKFVDNFASSPGSGHFAELGQRATIMQQQGTKLLGDVNTVLRSVLNIIYDLREFSIRIQQYDNFNSKDKGIAEGARLTLKQIWMDKVDIAKGNSSIKAMALGQGGFQTLIDAFLVAKDENDVRKLDLNERVRRILIPRIQEFNVWVNQSEKELRRRYELEKTYLKSQVNSLKLYSRWAKPYLRAAQELERSEKNMSPEMIKVFNTILLELTLMGSSKIKLDDLIVSGMLPREFKNLKIKRNYNKCVLVDFKFRGIPQKISQQSHFAFGGRAEVTFYAYALNDEELKKLKQELNKSDITDVLKLIDGITDDSLKQMQDDIDYFLNDMPDEEEKKKSSDESNPFLALIGYYDRNPKKKKESKKEEKKENNDPIKIGKEDYVEKNYLRKVAIREAVDEAFSIFDVYKKAHGMESYS